MHCTYSPDEVVPLGKMLLWRNRNDEPFSFYWNKQKKQKVGGTSCVSKSKRIHKCFCLDFFFLLLSATKIITLLVTLVSVLTFRRILHRMLNEACRNLMRFWCAISRGDDTRQENLQKENFSFHFSFFLPPSINKLFKIKNIQKINVKDSRQ